MQPYKMKKVAEFLIDQFVYNFVDNNGLDEADGLIVLFRKHVKDTKSIEKFNALCTKWEKLRSGNPSAASFSYPGYKWENSIFGRFEREIYLY